MSTHIPRKSAAPAGGKATGIELVVIVLILAMANFLALLDTTIANVLVPHISGSLGTSATNGTWVITGYAVAEAIMVPLTGWLAARFGPVRVFSTCIIGFGTFSFLCGVSTSMMMLIGCRVCLGICGGPLIPLSQTLLVKITPQKHMSVALTIWSMASILAPILGPVLGGVIGDSIYWGWAFYINVPLAILLTGLAWKFLMPHEERAEKTRADLFGLALLVLWVGALQIMLGKGQDLDWFSNGFIRILLVIVILGFISFLIWELTDNGPIVSLNVFHNRLFTISMVVIGVSFGSIFATLVLLPLWLQTAMGYTATWAGLNSAVSGISMLIAAPITTYLMAKVDMRLVVFIGLVLVAASNIMRFGYNDQITFGLLCIPLLLFGAGAVMSVLPLIEMSTLTLPDTQVASGAGLFNFVRTLCCAIATAAVTALWKDQIKTNHDLLAGVLHPQALMEKAQAAGISPHMGKRLLNLMVDGQSVMLATNDTFLIIGVITLAAGCLIWVAPKPRKAAAH